MKNNNIIIAETEQIFLEFVKNLEIKKIQNNDDIILGKKEYEESDLIVIYGKDISKTVEFIKNNYIVIEQILICINSEIVSNKELISGDIIIPNTFINKSGKTFFLSDIVGKDYNFKKFGLILSGICIEENGDNNEFQADIKSEKIFIYLDNLEKEELIDKVVVISQIEKQDNYENLVSVVNMMI